MCSFPTPFNEIINIDYCYFIQYNLMIYWFFALSLCFQIANRTAKQVMNTKKNDEVESVNKSV